VIEREEVIEGGRGGERLKRTLERPQQVRGDIKLCGGKVVKIQKV
jgi:hypothetical protein